MTISGTVTSFPGLDGQDVLTPGAFAASADGAVWFSTSRLGDGSATAWTYSLHRMDALGPIRTVLESNTEIAFALTTDAAGNAWFDRDGVLTTVTPSGSVQELADEKATPFFALTSSPDAVWLGNDTGFYRVDTATHAVAHTPFKAASPCCPRCFVQDLAVDGAGALWFGIAESQSVAQHGAIVGRYVGRLVP